MINHPTHEYSASNFQIQLSTTSTTMCPVQIVSNNSGKMVYKSWKKSRVELYSLSIWYEVKTLCTTLSNMRKCNFSVVEQWQQQLAGLNALDDSAPYAKDVRFPENKYYTCEATGNWLRKFQQLRTSITCKEAIRAIDGKSTVMTSDFNDRMLAFHNSISSLLSQISQSEYTYNRVSFETSYSEEWDMNA